MKYFYVAKSLKGEKVEGALEVRDEKQLVEILRRQNLILIKATKSGSKKAGGFNVNISLPFLDRVSLTEKMMFTRNLQVMVSAGLSLPKALQVLAIQAKSNKFKKALAKCREEVIKGENFSTALKKYPDIFSELFQNMVKVGEESGTMEDVLKVLARQMEREHELKSKILEALIYPAVVISAMIGIGMLMLIVVVPQLNQTFEDLGVELPMTTKIIIGVGMFLSQNWFLIPLIIAGLVFLSMTLLKNKKVKRLLDGLSLKLPVISRLITKTNSAFMTRTLASLIEAGVPLVRSLEIVSGTLTNIYFKESLLKSGEAVKKGEKLSEALKEYRNIYPPLVIQMIEVGQETGETSTILEKLASFFEQEVASETKNLTAVIEPFLMLIIGGVIGFFAISMVQPMYKMLEGIQ